MSLPSRHVLLFDGECGLCSRIVQLVLRADPTGRLCFASLQSAFAREVLAVHPELRGIDSVAWLEADATGSSVLVRSDAILRLGRYLGFPWNTVALARLIPRRHRDRLYDWVAQRRHQWFGPAAACSLPTAVESKRMVET
jgi:predicted DCC family thiol-disulfide oxidoreductase YuxK